MNDLENRELINAALADFERSDIELGMPTLIEILDLKGNFELCAQLELDFIEISMNLPEYQAASFPLAECKKLMREYGIYVTIHAEEKLSIADFNKAVAAAYTDTMIKAIELALFLKAAAYSCCQ